MPDPALVAVYRRLVDDVWNRGDTAALLELFHPDYIGHDPAAPNLIVGPAGMAGFVAEMRAAFPDWRVHTDDVVTEDDKLVSRWTVRATHRGPFAGLAPTGRRVEIRGMSIHQIAGGQIVENWHVVDRLGLLRQLGTVNFSA